MEPVRKTHWQKLRRAVVIYVLLPYFCVVLVFALIQRKLMYQPTRSDDLRVAAVGLKSDQFSDVSITTADGETIRGWLLKSNAKEPRPLVLYFGGNAGNRFERIDDLKEVAGCGYDVLVFDYRGFGDSTGSPSEAATTADARACWDYALSEIGLDQDRIVVFGESLGGAVALSLWSDESLAGPVPAGVILNSTFDSMPATVGSLYPAFPFRYFVWDRWSSIDRIRRVKTPITIFHGSADSMVPIGHARRLAEAGGTRVTFHEIEGAEHNHLPHSQLRMTLKAVTERMQGSAAVSTGQSVDQPTQRYQPASPPRFRPAP